MAQTLQTLIHAPIIELNTIDSTNNYAMQLIDADTAQAGLTIVTREQTAGKGQRGKYWESFPGESLLASVICTPQFSLDKQFLFSACVANSVVDVLYSLYQGWNIKIKWPNDIIINDKKAAGILIENVLRGNKWIYSVVGIGINVQQTSFSEQLPNAISLKMASGFNFDMEMLLNKIRGKILQNTYTAAVTEEIIRSYNNYLYRREQLQTFRINNAECLRIVKRVDDDGKLSVEDERAEIYNLTHGRDEWIW